MSTIEAGSHDLAEQFASGFDAWSGQASINDVDRWADDNQPEIEQLARSIASSGGATPVLRHLEGDLEAQFVALAAMDEALGLCHPRRGAPSSLDPLASRYRTTGNLLPEKSPVGGGLVPRWVQPHVGDGTTDRVEDAFVNVRRVSPRSWNVLKVVPLRALDDLPSSSRSSARPLRIAFTPVLLDLDDVDVQQGEGLSGVNVPWYNLGPAHGVSARLPSLLAELDASGADLAMCPEGAVDETMAAVWQELLRSNERSPDSRLRWIMIGSGRWDSTESGRPFNRALLMHRDTGEILMRHDKFAPFNLNPQEQIDRWGLAHLFEAPPPIYENALRGETVEVLESRAGRIALMICEDLTRVGTPCNDSTRLVGPALVLTPVFARQTNPYRWEHNAAGVWWRLEGTAVAVCNSLVVPQAELQADPSHPRDSRIDHDAPFCLLLSEADSTGATMGRSRGEQVVVRPLG